MGLKFSHHVILCPQNPATHGAFSTKHAPQQVVLVLWDLGTLRRGQHNTIQKLSLTHLLETRFNEKIRKGGKQKKRKEDCTSGNLYARLVFGITCCGILNTPHLPCSVSTFVKEGEEGNGLFYL